MASKNLAEGQQWHTRGGAIVRVAKDRKDFAALPEWRWALSNSYICNDEGRVDAKVLHHSDLTHLVGTPPVVSDEAVQGMDSTWAGFK